ncbi:hypothetical protein KJ807_03340 [Patescibacteria group bacterium]|nr:hypothetical protein [Patescibacteria group bacterium]MBU1939064.1 hypothetical protein [Patescibacteria group bacterium]
MKSRLQGIFRSEVYNLLLAGAVTLGVSACGNGDPNNNPDGGAGTGGGGTGGNTEGGGGTGGGGGEAGSDPCKDLEFEGLASGVYEVDEAGSFAVEGLQGPDGSYNGMSFEVKDGSMFVRKSRVGLMKVVYSNYKDGYGAIGDVSGVRPVVFDDSQNYVLDENENCVLNTVSLNQEILDDPLKRPVMKTPEGFFTTVFRVKDGTESTADYALLSDRTEFTLDSITASEVETDYILANSKPEISASVTRDQDDRVILDLTGSRDENDSSEATVGALGVSATGPTLEPIPGQPGKFISTLPFLDSVIPLSVSGRNQPLTDDTVQVQINVPPKPEISNLAIDCSGPPAPGACVAGGFVYPVGFNTINANGCIATPESLGIGTPGSTSVVDLIGTNGSFDYTTGSQAGDIIKITVDCNGNGGVDIESIQFEIP